MWNFFLKDRVIISTTPFEYSLYGTPELVNLYKKKIFNNSDIEFLNDYLKEIPGKYNYSKEKILECVPDEYKNKIVTMDSPYDIFVPGQTPRLLGCEKILYNHDEEMTISLAQKYPNYKIVYKPHPFRAGFIKTMGAIKKELFELPNIFITADNIHEIFPKIGEVYTINSSVGIDAGLRGKKVHWMSKTPFSEFDLTKRENRYAIIHAARKISTHKKNLTKVMSNIVQYRLDETL
jgi:capsule polysaccharide export protein KpsC/LpsZ